MSKASTFFKQVPVAKVLKIAKLDTKIEEPVQGTKKSETVKTK